MLVVVRYGQMGGSDGSVIFECECEREDLEELG